VLLARILRGLVSVWGIVVMLQDKVSNARFPMFCLMRQEVVKCPNENSQIIKRGHSERDHVDQTKDSLANASVTS